MTLTQKQKTWLLYAVYIAALLPIIILRDFTPANELRYLSIADEALSNHNFFAFTNQGEPYADKPPLYLWGVILCRWIAGGHYMWLLSLLSVIPAIVTARIMDRWVGTLLPDKTRIYAQLMLLTAGLFFVSSVTMRMDMMMCMFIVLSLYEFWKICTDNPHKRRHQWLFPLYVFLAVFTKGPYGFLIPLVATISYLLIKKEYRRIGAVWGWRFWLVIIAGCAIWFGSVYADGGKEYLNNLLFHQTMDRAVKSFHHSAPFYYYLVCIWYCLVPWSLAMLAMIIRGIQHKSKPTGLQGFFIITAVSSLIMISCFSSKIQIYMLPTVPFIVYAMALSMRKYAGDSLVKAGLAVIAAVFCLALPGFAAAKIIVSNELISSGWYWVTATALSVCGVFTLISLYHPSKAQDALGRATAWMSAAMLAAIFTIGMSMTSINKYIGYKALSEKVMQVSERTGIRELRSWRIKRIENMDVFLRGNEIRNITDEEYFPAHLDDPDEGPYVLAIRLKHADMLPGAKIDTVGKYGVTVINGPKTRE